MFVKKSILKKISFDLSVTFKRTVQNCLSLTLKLNFQQQKPLESFWFFSLKTICLGEGFYNWGFSITLIFETICFLKWCSIFDDLYKSQWKSNQNTYFSTIDFWVKIYSQLTLVLKNHHWGHATLPVWRSLLAPLDLKSLIKIRLLVKIRGL